MNEEEIYKMLLTEKIDKFPLLNEIFAIRNNKFRINDYTIYVSGCISLDVINRAIEKANYISKLQKELEQEKEKNKKLNLENQALFENINCNDDNMLARRYQILQKELDKKDKVIDLIITDYLNLSKERMSKEEFKKWYFDLVGIKKVEVEND